VTLAIDRKGKLKVARNKYGVAPAHERTIDGHVFASKREATRYRELCLMQRCGDISGLELQPRFDFPMGFRYTADFWYVENGREIVEDVKGVKPRDFSLRIKCLAYFFPKVNLRITK
jgi:hypothetical protein